MNNDYIVTSLLEQVKEEEDVGEKVTEEKAGVGGEGWEAEVDKE